MADLSLTRRSACKLVELVRAREITPVEVVEAHLALIRRINPALNAIVTLDAERALAFAQAAERLLNEGEAGRPLLGLPVTIKDVTDTAGLRTTFGSPRYKDHLPEQDAEVVKRLKQAGAIVLGKTNTPEFACGATTNNALFGPTHNPWRHGLTPGGSSGGSAAAVASGMVPLAQGTDFGGSIRVPASFCGIVGLRPTPGVIPNHPMPLAWDFGQVHGPIARCAEDAALMLDAMIGLSTLSPISVQAPWSSASDEVRATRSLEGLRVAFVADLSGFGIEAEIETICRRAAQGLADCGASVEEIACDISEGKGAYHVWRGVWMIGQQHERLSDLQAFGSNLRTNIESGLRITTRDIATAAAIRQNLYARFRELFERYDALLTPTVPVEPFSVELDFPATINGKEIDNYIDWVAQTYLITLLSLPAASAPAGTTAGGLPVGLQIVAPRFQEPRILAIAKFIQEQWPAGWPKEISAP